MATKYIQPTGTIAFLMWSDRAKNFVVVHTTSSKAAKKMVEAGK